MKEEIFKRRQFNLAFNQSSRLMACTHPARSWLLDRMERNRRIIIEYELEQREAQYGREAS